MELLVDGGWGLLTGCGYCRVAGLHQTGPGEFPMTCFTPTPVPLLKKKIKQREVESQLEYLFEAGGKSLPVVWPCECSALLCLKNRQRFCFTGTLH